MPEALVSTEWLATHLEAPDVRVVDATWFLPGTDRSARAEHEAGHIPGAVFFDLDAVCEPKGLHPHMVPSAAKFSSRVRKLGLGDGSRIVVYDDNRFIASARVWWLFRLMGHDDVLVLDGGLAKWRAEGRPLTDTPTRPQERHFTVRQNTLIHRELDQVRANLTSKREQIVDARSAGRFHAREPEPREGLRSGHIPGAKNLHYVQLVAEDGTLKPAAELRRLFAGAGVDLGQPVVTSCGSGVSATLINLALFELGVRNAALYDGSWAEWGAQADTPVAS
ncbi:MAG: 3-mercaptopyruvate sulfurtransferase [Geminicoccaceae bacterium]